MSNLATVHTTGNRVPCSTFAYTAVNPTYFRFFAALDCSTYRPIPKSIRLTVGFWQRLFMRMLPGCKSQWVLAVSATHHLHNGPARVRNPLTASSALRLRSRAVCALSRIPTKYAAAFLRVSGLCWGFFKVSSQNLSIVSNSASLFAS